MNCNKKDPIQARFFMLNEALATDDSRKCLQHIYCDGVKIVSTNGRMLVITDNSEHLEKGFYDLATAGTGRNKRMKFVPVADEKAKEWDYPNWKQIVPSGESLTHEVRLEPEQIEAGLKFLKTVPEKMPYNPIELKMSADKRLVLSADDGLEVTLDAELLGDWTDFSQSLNKNILSRLFAEKHTRIQLSNLNLPLMATGGLGRYIAMPMRNAPIKTQPQNQPQIQPNKEPQA